MSEVSAYEYGRKVRFDHTFKVDGTATNPSTITVNVKVTRGKGAAKVTLFEESYVYGTDEEVVKPSLTTGRYYFDQWLTIGDADWVIQFVGTGACEYIRTRTFYVKENLAA